MPTTLESSLGFSCKQYHLSVNLSGLPESLPNLRIMDINLSEIANPGLGRVPPGNT